VQLLGRPQLGQHLQQLIHVVSGLADHSPALTACVGCAHREAVFVNVQSDMNLATLIHGRSPYVADDASLSM
jgi:hypothetical protein